MSNLKASHYWTMGTSLLMMSTLLSITSIVGYIEGTISGKLAFLNIAISVVGSLYSDHYLQKAYRIRKGIDKEEESFDIEKYLDKPLPKE